MKLLLAIGSVLLSAQVYAGSLTIQELGTTTETGDYPVCSNGAGKLLPCAGDVIIPDPPPDSNVGNWSGKMLYDRNYPGTDTCYDYDVTFRVSYYDYEWDKVWSTIYKNAGGQVDFSSDWFYVDNKGGRDPGYADNSIKPFDQSTIDFFLQFNFKGYADGQWKDRQYDCFGTWAMTKD